MTNQPADLLRAAAQKIRDLAKAIEAPDLPDQTWHIEECASEERGDCPCIVAQGRYSAEPSGTMQPMFYVADAETPECADWIAAMHPGVGTALADLLDDQADGDDEGVINPWALAVARAILGSSGA